MIFNMVGGAGGSSDELSFTVVGGTSAPSNPSENTIWINTDATITSWLFDTVAPSSPSEGMVWISTGEYSIRKFNILTENDVQVYPLSTKQYISGAWVDVTGKIYQGGSWVDWFTYLYKYGDKCTDTGSWTAAEKWKSYDYYYQTHTGNPKTPTVTWNADHAVVNCGNGETYRSGIFYKNTKIDLTNYKKITFDGKLNSGEVSLYVWSSIGNLYDSEHVVAKKAITNTSRASIELSVSSLSGSYYIGFGMYGVEASAVSTMYQLYLS